MADGTIQPKIELDRLIRGLEETISLCEAARRLLASRGNGEGTLPDGLPVILERYIITESGLLFEPEHPEYPTRSIPAALNYLRFHADYLKIEHPEAVIERLIRFGHEPKQFEGIPDPWITQLLRKEFAERLPRENAPDAGELSAALHTVRLLRGKFPIDPSDRAEIGRATEVLLAYAGDFTRTVRQGYF